MNKNIMRILSALLAILTVFSVCAAAVSAAEIGEEETGQAVEAAQAEEAELAGVGAEYEEIAEVGLPAPVFTSAESGVDGIILKWEAVGGVSSYRVDKYYEDGRGWQTLTTTGRLTYTDAEVANDKAYQYRLLGLNGSGSVITSTTTKTVTYYAPLRVTELEVGDGGIRVHWNMSPRFNKAAVYRMNNGKWICITTTADSSYFDRNVFSGSTYRYTVRGLNASGAFVSDDYDETGMSVQYLSVPSLRAENAPGGVSISWDKVEGAAAYRVFYRNSKGDWSRLVTTTETSVLDDDVRSDRSYTYTVRCVSADGEVYTSYYDRNGKTVKYIAAPVLKSADSVTDGIQITWAKSEGAAQYRVFYKNSKGDWARLGTTTGTSFLDKDVRSGSTYTYTVRCMNSAGEYISSFYPHGINGTYASAPDFSVSSGADGVDISWKAVPGAEKYRVYYYGSKGWTKLVDTAATSYTDTDVLSGSTYTYTVRCISADGNRFASGYLPGKKVKYYAAPGITAVTNTTEGVKITWNAVPTAEKYRVYYYGRNGWTKMADTAATSYLDKAVSSGVTYTYTVRGINAAGTEFRGYFKPGIRHMYVDAPNFSLSRGEKSITVSWDKVEGAELYRVYARTENGWQKIKDTTGTSYTDDDVISGNTYTYTVRCLNADASQFTSDYREGKSMKIVEMPKVSSVENTTQGVEVRWGACQGAVKYRVYIKSNGWTKIGETTENKFVHTTAESGKDYTYTVRCINAAGTEFESEFDRTGKSIHYIAAPKNIKVESEKNTIKISWTPSAGAEKYRVYYYGSKGWTKLTETTGSSVIDDDVASGYTYRYTVRCITADGKAFTSDCETPGVSYKFTYVPTLKTPDYTKNGVEIMWNKSPGAEKYRVYYYGSKGWTKMAETTATSYIDTDVESNHTYRYTVRCITADGKAFTSDCDTTGVKIYYVAAPRLVSSDADWNSLTFTWNKPAGATKFRVYKKVSGSWKRLTDTTSNSYTDKDVESGETYTYTVRVINKDGNQFCSGFDPEGFIIKAEVEDVDVDGFVYYDQGAYSYPYGDDTIAYSGCGPTCFAMIASTLTGKSITPVDAVKWCGNSYYVDNVGTRWDYFDAASRKFGITMEKQLGRSEINTVIAELKKGKYVISAQSAGRFTRGGHFIVLAGVTSGGKIIVYDPNGGNHYVGTAFDPSEITASGTQYWVFSK
ncbi:MAG: hypothetical protein IJH40_02015 [Ruminococcus sp.]|uniref:fibronectin type III domain-containing protein n=1 Tax=Ruminococcus sp. TaxID=41978 RepID=UPI002873C27A|nr:papain-like cysteine protease family protein [Ruminococcus sp.]MBQ3284393.1 hypothetical protein [Ruminococcus sp.]